MISCFVYIIDTPDTVITDLKKKLNDEGFECCHTTIGGEGVHIHSNNDNMDPFTVPVELRRCIYPQSWWKLNQLIVPVELRCIYRPQWWWNGTFYNTCALWTWESVQKTKKWLKHSLLDSSHITKLLLATHISTNHITSILITPVDVNGVS